MSYLFRQTDYDDVIELGPYDYESISQSIYFKRRFLLNYVYIHFGNITLDSINEIKIRCEVRLASGDDYLLNMSDTPVMTSVWYGDQNITSNAYRKFWLAQTELAAGIYYFSLVSNMRVAYPMEISIQSTGSFLGKFIKIKDGIGTYFNTKSIVIDVHGSWTSSNVFDNSDVEENVYATSTIRDMIS